MRLVFTILIIDMFHVNLPTFDNFYSKFRQAFYEYRKAQMANDILADLLVSPHHFRYCPACPRPGEDGDVHIAIDACFRLGRRAKAGKHNDISNSNLFFPDGQCVKDYLTQHNADHPVGSKKSGSKKSPKKQPKKPKETGPLPETNRKRIVPCGSLFKAGDEKRARSRTEILDVKAVMAIVCARHGFPLIMIDMYHGERFEYADFILVEYLKQFENTTGILHFNQREDIHLL